MRTTVDIDAHLLKRLRAEAHRRGVSVKEFLAGILRRGLEERPARARTRYRCPAYSLGVPNPGFDLDKALAAAAVLEDEETSRKLALRK
jgi:hypothetical protein